MINMLQQLQVLFTDRANISRYIETEEDGLTTHQLTLLKTGVKCRLSKNSVRSLEQNQVATFTNQYKLFFGPEAGIIEGDIININTFTFIAGEVMPQADFFVTLLKREVIA